MCDRKTALCTKVLGGNLTITDKNDERNRRLKSLCTVSWRNASSADVQNVMMSMMALKLVFLQFRMSEL